MTPSNTRPTDSRTGVSGSTENDSDPSLYSLLTPKAVKELLSPHTWVASIAPVLLGASLAIGFADYHSLVAAPKAIVGFTLMLITAVLLQSAVNVLNDYVDFKKGTDTADNCVDVTDASIVFNNINPKDALKVALWCLGAAAVSGLTVVFMTDIITLGIGLAGAATVALYSAGPKPISYQPLGEFVSGFVMGELITFATYYVLTGYLNWWVLAYALPAFFTIALIMQANNTCDVARDKEAGRRTLPILLGQKLSGHVMASINVISLIIMAAVGALYFIWGVWIVAIALALSWRNIRTLWSLEYGPATRPLAMGTAVKQAVILNVSYILMILIGAFVNV